MDILFLHQNMPGQFRHLAPALADNPDNRVVFITRRDDVDLPGVRRISYPAPRASRAETHFYIRTFENAVRHGQSVIRQCQTLQREGFRPDIVIAHPGWGESLFIRDFWPDTKIISYAEFYYHGQDSDLDFNPDDPPDLDLIFRARARNAHLALSLEAADIAVSPTMWQRALHPAALRSKIEVIFDGIDTASIRPDAAARFVLDDGRILTPDDEVISFVARNLEPYRGFDVFMRALPRILTARPRAQVVILGGDDVSYGRKPFGASSWRAKMLKDVDLARFEDRVHFLGRIPYPRYLNLLQRSSAHIYLTYPFVLSWSCLEAMASGCLVIASDTPPVAEVIENGVNGLLFPFYDTDALAERTIAALANAADYLPLRAAARENVIERYDLQSCLMRQCALIERVVGRPVTVRPTVHA